MKRRAKFVITRLSEIAREHREARVLDALAEKAMREHRTGQTRSLRDYARDRTIVIDDTRSLDGRSDTRR